MATLSRRSREILNGCHRDLVRLCEKAIQTADFSVVEGHRDEETQARMVREGKSKVAWPHSKHNQIPSEAVHLLPHPFDASRDWTEWRRFDQLSGVIRQCAVDLMIWVRWGGDWDMDWDFRDQTFHDLLHWELTDV